jgi:hypothetical protein
MGYLSESAAVIGKINQRADWHESNNAWNAK